MLLYYITDRKSFAGTPAEQRTGLLLRIADAARAGVDYIQLREKDLRPRELEQLARDVVRAVRENSTATKVLINSRADVALAVGADGVHLPTGELSASQVRALWLKRSHCEPLFGVSAHTAADIRDAQEQGASFAVLAPVFEKLQTHAQRIGLEGFRAACADSSTRGSFAVLALGGVTLSNARACSEAGAAGVAGIRLFQQGDIFKTVLRLHDL
jgi:thiamine-phosphate pyrophosphorylase